MKKPITLRLRAFTQPMRSKKFASSLTDDELIAAVESGETLTDRQQKRYEKVQQAKLQLQIINDLKALIPAWGVWGGQSLTFDTETLNVDRGQVARFGVAQLRGMKYHELVEFMEANDSTPTREELDVLRETYIFYHRDNLAVEAENINDAIALLQAHCSEKGYKLISQAEFVTKIFLKHWYIKDDIPMPIMVIGHNLPFDIGALAVHTGFSEGRDMFGGFSIAIAGPQKTKRGKEWNLPRVRIKKIGVKKYRIKCTPTENAKLISHTFIDTLQLSKALQGAQTPASMDYLCQLFKIRAHETDESYGKQHVDHFKPLTDEYIQYCRDDVERTWQIYSRLRKIYVNHDLSTPIDKISSEASVGKAYYKDLGITPFLEMITNAEDTHYKDLMLQTCGIAMEAMAGARAECRCRHQVREGIGADFKSEYPTINYLLGLQDLLIAERVDIVDCDANGEAAQFLRNTAIADLLSADKAHMLSTWRGLRGYALVDPACGVWPVRTLYTEDLDDDDNEDNQTDRGTVAQSAINIGVNRVAHGPYIWVSFLDVLSSKLTTGVFPKIIKTRTLKPVGRQKDLKAIKFFGDDDYIIDLTKEGVDLFKRVIDMRGEIKVKRDECIKGSDEYNRLDAMQMALKLIANATSYGILVQFDVDESNAQVQVDVYYGDKKYTKEARETIVGYDGTRKISGFKAEKPGKWFSPWGPLITAGGRLLIAIAETLAKENGIEYGMCDTDSMFFIRPINPETDEYSMTREEFIRRVMLIADKSGLFQNINPYERIWNKTKNRFDIDAVFSVEDVNYAYNHVLCNVVVYNDPKDVHYYKTLKPLYILSISAKRYALANITRQDDTDYDTVEELETDAKNAVIVLRKVSGHGLGHISAPSYSPVDNINHSAVPYSKKGEPLYNDVCKGKGNPRLFLDMWYTAFRQFLVGWGKDSDVICKSIDKIIKNWKGLEQPQFQQRSLNTAACMDCI